MPELLFKGRIFNDKTYYRTGEVASILRIGARDVVRLRKGGQIRHVMSYGRYYYSADDVMRLYEMNTVVEYKPTTISCVDCRRYFLAQMRLTNTCPECREAAWRKCLTMWVLNS